MKIAFTGIKNLHIAKKEYSKYGAYVTPDSNIKNGNKHITEVKITCNLTDDEKGDDLRKFSDALKRSGAWYQTNCINMNEPDKITLHMIRQDVDDINVRVVNSDFKLNNLDLFLSRKDQLPIYSYMAYLTRTISNLPDVSNAQKHYAELVNQSVADEAVKFIETY